MEEKVAYERNDDLIEILFRFLRYLTALGHLARGKSLFVRFNSPPAYIRPSRCYRQLHKKYHYTMDEIKASQPVPFSFFLIFFHKSPPPNYQNLSSESEVKNYLCHYQRFHNYGLKTWFYLNTDQKKMTNCLVQIMKQYDSAIEISHFCIVSFLSNYIVCNII